MTALDALITEARRCAGLFRLGRDIEAALAMVELIDSAMPLVNARPMVEQQGWGQILSAILDCQERQDWIGLADWLEVEFVVALQRAQ
ncbi:hypothetical protein ABQX22_10115 [Xanthomonas sp. WHRI 1810A]|uniref:hypothetical protein n=1 Tax=Xanthomonas sp. WHRI 1810A TaxID=3161565 RepID=UPI0032E878FE